MIEMNGRDLPRVVPAECMEYLMPDFLSRRWTWATSWETEAVGVPMGTRQKSFYIISQVISSCSAEVTLVAVCISSPVPDGGRTRCAGGGSGELGGFLLGHGLD